MRFKVQPQKKDPGENLIPLINVIFLMLIFFLAASTIRPFSDRQIKLAEAVRAGTAGSGLRMAVLRSDGTAVLGGQEVGPEELQRQFTAWAADDPDRGVTLVADRAMPADRLIEVVTQANAAGISNVKLLTQKARQTTMRLKFAHWLMAGVFALALHAALLLTYQPSLSDSSPQSTGPRIEMADSLAGVLGQPLEVSDRPVIEKQVAAEPVETVEATEPVKLAATAPVEVPDTVTAVEAIPTTPTKKVETSEPAPTLQAKPVEEAKPKKKVKTKKVKRKKTRKTKKSSGKRTTRNRGNSKKGNAGKSKRRGRASASAIASYGSKVRSRIASAARRAGRQKGRVTVTVRISSSGRVTSVSARGPSSLTGAVKSAVRGTSFPRPPAGMGSRSFSVSISFR